MEIRIGDWVTLDYEKLDNRAYHEYRKDAYNLIPGKEYEVVDIGTSSKKPLLTLDTYTSEGEPTFYKCFEYRVNLSRPAKEVILWK